MEPNLAAIAKLRLTRNTSCPCGSKRKVKHCCPFFLKVRPELTQREFTISAALADYNRKHEHKLTRNQYVEKLLEEQEREQSK